MIGELLKPPAPKATSSVPSPNPVTWAPVTGSGRSCTEMVTVPHAYRLGSSVASATWYCRVVLTGAAPGATSTVRVDRSSLGSIVTPSGRLSSSPRTPTTRSGVPGNGFVAPSFASTSIVVVRPRAATATSAAGWASGRVDGTTRRSMRPGRPSPASSATAIVTAWRVPVTVDSAASIVSS